MHYDLSFYTQYALINHDIPYCYQLNKNHKALYYYGTKHSNDFNDDIFKDIHTKLLSFKPNLVIVEGFTQINSQNKNTILKALKKMKVEDIIKTYGENIYTAHLAALHDIEVCCPEPDLIEEATIILNEGFTKEDVFLYYVCRYIFQWFRIKNTCEVTTYIKKGISYLKQKLLWDDFDFSYNNFHLIYKKKLGESIIIDDPQYYEQLLDPVPRKNNYIYIKIGLNEIARISNNYRDYYMIEQIKTLISIADRIFIVFGATHAYFQQISLTKLFSDIVSNIIDLR